MKSDVARLKGFIPIRFLISDGVPEVRWSYVGQDRLSEPFFDNSIESRLQRPFELFFQPRTPIETLAGLPATPETAKPAGFIFHMSRCGSTLITQMLAALPRNIVLSEPSPIDSILKIRQRYPQVTEAQQIDWLRWMTAAFGQPRIGERELFIKFDCWHVFFIPLLRQAFPDVPFLFLYRDPVEVLVSQMSRRGAQMIPGLVQPDVYGIDLEEAITLSGEEYCARVVRSICRTALDHHRQDPMLLLNYSELPGAVSGAMAEYFRLDFDAAEIELMDQAAQFNAKYPEVRFAPDAVNKRSAASDEVLRACETHLVPLYREMEEARAELAAEGAGAQVQPL